LESERLDVVATRFDVFLIRLDPTEGHEIRKTRPCLIISPDEMNRHIDTVIVAPMTPVLTRLPRMRRDASPPEGRSYPTRVPLRFKGKSGQVVLDQIRTVDKNRLVKRLGKIDEATRAHVLALLAELFAP
jgi:mRNA interferase MazF